MNDSPEEKPIDTDESNTGDPIAGDTLPAALARYAIDLPDDQIEQLDRYCRLLWEWNEKLNLTRHTTYEKFVSRDVVDSLALEPFLDSGEHVLDLGTGGGVPGIVLAIVRPDLQVELSESVAKKARAVAAIVQEMPLAVKAHHARAEDLLDESRFDTIVARAVAPLPKLLTWLQPHWDSVGQLLLIKGPVWVQERGEARQRGLMNGLQLRKLAEYPLAGADSPSVVIQVRPRVE